MSWQLLDTLPGGHRLFANQADYPGQVAIADESGRTPPDTDDGVCLIDVQRPILVQDNAPGAHGFGVASLPIILADRGREQSWTPVGLAGALYLADQHRMVLRTDATGSYRVVHLNES